MQIYASFLFTIFQNPKSFVIDLLRYLKQELAQLPRVPDGHPTTTKRVNHLESALEALRNVVRSYAGKYFFSLLKLFESTVIFCIP